MIDLTGRVALVTGGGQGIGKATASTLLGLGAAVCVLDRDDVPLQALRDEHDGAALSTSTGDVTVADDVELVVSGVVEQHGRLDILVNNAGITRDDLLFKMSEEHFDAVLATHLRGAFLCSRAAQRHMVEQRYGKIVMLSSRSALGNRGQTNYAAAKAGLIGMTRTLALELGPFGINVNAVAPGHIETAMTRAVAARVGLDYEQVKEESAARTPLRRVGTPQDVANVIAFLASDASSYVSGETIWIAGGPVGLS